MILPPFFLIYTEWLPKPRISRPIGLTPISNGDLDLLVVMVSNLPLKYRLNRSFELLVLYVLGSNH